MLNFQRKYLFWYSLSPKRLFEKKVSVCMLIFGVLCGPKNSAKLKTRNTHRSHMCIDIVFGITYTTDFVKMFKQNLYLRPD